MSGILLNLQFKLSRTTKIPSLISKTNLKGICQQESQTAPDNSRSAEESVHQGGVLFNYYQNSM
jgi:hypothetical protein